MVEDFEDWLAGLDEKKKSDLTKKGFDFSKTALPFTRCVQNGNDLVFDEYYWVSKGRKGLFGIQK